MMTPDEIERWAELLGTAKRLVNNLPDWTLDKAGDCIGWSNVAAIMEARNRLLHAIAVIDREVDEIMSQI